MPFRIISVAIHAEIDVVASRQRARQVASLCGFGPQDQARIATAVSELARNVYNYASHGTVEFSIEGETEPQVLIVSIDDEGPGIKNLPLILSGKFQSATGMGLGILGARRLMDQCEVTSHPGRGTSIVLKKLLPKNALFLTPKHIGEMNLQLDRLPSDALLSEVQQQNTELLGTLAELKVRQDELLQMTRELEDTNRGVVALYAELDEKAEHLRRADEMKSRFLSNMSHEFRTPLSSIRALSKLLLNRTDGDLSEEQEKQVHFILKGAESLSELVDDLLDLAKIEAGKIDVRPEKFSAADLFSALRGMMRPLLTTDSVKLIFETPADDCVMISDEAKVSQILRNFISNALKFTEAGEVRVSAHSLQEEAAIRFSVVDTGLGILPEHQHLIFEEFGQIESHLQQKVKGTGLGLPLCRKLAVLLGGEVSLKSSLGKGSIFSVTLPMHYNAQKETSRGQENELRSAASGMTILFVEDRHSASLSSKQYLQNMGLTAVSAHNVREADDILNAAAPDVVVLDIPAGDEDSWRWLMQIKSSDQHKHIPVIVADEEHDPGKALSLGADTHLVKPMLEDELLAALRQHTPAGILRATNQENTAIIINAVGSTYPASPVNKSAESGNRH